MNPDWSTSLIGFNAEIGNGQKEDIGSLLQQVLPEDFVKFGLIPEFIGRVPVNLFLKSSGQRSACAHTERTEERTGETVSEAVWNLTE